MCPALLQATDILDNSLLSISRYLTPWKNLCNTYLKQFKCVTILLSSAFIMTAKVFLLLITMAKCRFLWVAGT
jgi:hypothetical protein